MPSINELYSYNGEVPKPLPNRIRLSDGTTRTDVSTYTSDMLTSLGYVGPITRPTESDSIASIQWDSGSSSYTTTSYDSTYYLNKLREDITSYLGHCDWTVADDSPLSSSLKSEWETYRTTLNELEAATTDPQNPVWPTAPAYSE